MIKNKRQQQILNMLNDNKIVSAVELSEKLNCSQMTIRRDLEYFYEMGLVRRIHGGAILIEPEAGLPPFTERFDRCQREKNAIGKAAANFIKKESIVCMDAGTTTLSIVQHIPEDAKFTVISTGIRTSSALCHLRDIDIIQVGGLVHHSSFTVCDFLAHDFISKFNADVAFFSTRALLPTKGTFESNMSLVGEKTVLASISKKIIVLADHTKFEGTSLLQALPVRQIDVVITDEKTPEDAIKQLRSIGIEVVIVTPE